MITTKDLAEILADELLELSEQARKMDACVANYSAQDWEDISMTIQCIADPDDNWSGTTRDDANELEPVLAKMRDRITKKVRDHLFEMLQHIERKEKPEWWITLSEGIQDQKKGNKND